MSVAWWGGVGTAYARDKSGLATVKKVVCEEEIGLRDKCLPHETRWVVVEWWKQMLQDALDRVGTDRKWVCS